VVAFPLATLLFKFDASESRDAALLVQAVGMTAAAYLLVLRKAHLLDARLIMLSIASGTVGITTGITSIEAPPDVVNLVYTVAVFEFAIIYWFVSTFEVMSGGCADEEGGCVSGGGTNSDVDFGLENGEDGITFDQGMDQGSQQNNVDGLLTFNAPKRKHDRQALATAILMLLGVMGGLISSKVGTGGDMMVFLGGMFVWNVLCKCPSPPSNFLPLTPCSAGCQKDTHMDIQRWRECGHAFVNR
jgi:hypothetical protein